MMLKIQQRNNLHFKIYLKKNVLRVDAWMDVAYMTVKYLCYDDQKNEQLPYLYPIN